MSDAGARVVVSVSYGLVENATMTRSTHLMTYEGEVPSEALAKAIADAVVNYLSASNNFGVYKTEFPHAVNLQPKTN